MEIRDKCELEQTNHTCIQLYSYKFLLDIIKGKSYFFAFKILIYNYFIMLKGILKSIFMTILKLGNRLKLKLCNS